MSTPSASAFLSQTRGFVVHHADSLGGTTDRGAVAPRRFRHDPADKLLLGQSLIIAGFIHLVFPNLPALVGREAPFTAQDITVLPLESVEGGTPDAPDLTSRYSDVTAFLTHEDQLAAIVLVEIQARYQPEMSARMLNYASHALDWFYRHNRPRDRAAAKPPPIAPLLIAMGERHWPADGGPWAMEAGSEGPLILVPTRTYERQDIADWYAQPRDNPPLVNWVEVFFRLAILRADSRELLTRHLGATPVNGIDEVRVLAQRTLDLMQRIAAKARAEDKAAGFEESCLFYLVRWVNGALLPLWSAILNKEIEALDTVEGLTMFEDVVKEVRDTYQANLDFMHTEGLQKGRQEGRQEGRKEGWQELVRQAVADQGVFTPDELAEYCAVLDKLPPYQIPNALEVNARLAACPVEQRFATAWQILDEAQAIPEPDGP